MQKKFLEAGEIVGTHGIHGEVKILPWADSPDFLLSFDTYYIKGTPRRVLSARVHKTCVLAKLEGVETPEQASLLRRQVICIDREVISLPEGSVYIAAGPVFKEGKRPARIGQEHPVAVPDGFFKVVLSLRKGAEKAIGFYYENNSVKQPMEQTAMSVDDVETLTGMDFFPALDDDLENRLEATFKLKEWR